MNSKNFNMVPNQHIYVIHREPIGKNFISISKDSFAKAYRDMSNTPSALGLYIWLVGNQDKYKFAFSPQAIENQIGMARSSCHGAVTKLLNLGYLVKRENSNVYDFNEISAKAEKMENKPVEEESSPSETTTPSEKIDNRREFEFWI